MGRACLLAAVNGALTPPQGPVDASVSGTCAKGVLLASDSMSATTIGSTTPNSIWPVDAIPPRYSAELTGRLRILGVSPSYVPQKAGSGAGPDSLEVGHYLRGRLRRREVGRVEHDVARVEGRRIELRQ